VDIGSSDIDYSGIGVGAVGSFPEMTDDATTWTTCPVSWLWIYDKLIVARKQDILVGPAGVPVPQEGWYVVRPITNIRMMGRGAQKMYLRPGEEDLVPDGYFWSEVLEGDHVSVDYKWGRQVLAVQGFREDTDRLDRFDRWERISRDFPLPYMLQGLHNLATWINVEMIGDRIIEVHLRYNDDFANHDAGVIYPVWRDTPRAQPPGTEWYDSACGDRLGFWVQGTVSYK
jgi:hypothetical protein